MGPHRVAEWMPYYLADLFASVLPRVRGPSVFFCHIPWRQAHSGHIGRKWAKRPRHVMWQNRLYPCAIFTETSGEFAPHYLAGIRHDLRQTTAAAYFLEGVFPTSPKIAFYGKVFLTGTW